MIKPIASYNKNLIILILLSAVGKLFFGSITELSNDEVYYVTYAYFLQWNYFDHPPGVALLLKLFTVDLYYNSEFFVRLGPVLCCAISTWLVYKIGTESKDATTGWLSALLYTASIYGSIISGLMLLPDAPMVLFWLWSIYLSIVIFKQEGDRQKVNKRLIVWGVVTGLAIICKLNSVFLVGGFLLYTVFYQRVLWRNYFFYISLLIVFFICLPVILWNIDSSSASFSFHSKRISFDSNSIHVGGFIKQLIGEVAYINPVCFSFIIAGLIASSKKNEILTIQVTRILLCFSLPLILCIWFFSWYSDTFPHWSGPAWLVLLFFAAAFLAERNKTIAAFRPIPPFARVAICIPVILLLSVAVSVYYLPISFNANNEKKIGQGDILLEFSGWKDLEKQFSGLYKNDIASKRMKQGAFLLSDYWFPAAHLDYYVAKPNKYNFMAVGSYTAIHHFAWVNKKRSTIQEGDDAYLVIISNYFNEPPAEIIRCFEAIEKPEKLLQKRAHKNVRVFWIYRLKNYQGGIPATGILLPD